MCADGMSDRLVTDCSCRCMSQSQLRTSVLWLKARQQTSTQMSCGRHRFRSGTHVGNRLLRCFTWPVSLLPGTLLPGTLPPGTLACSHCAVLCDHRMCVVTHPDKVCLQMASTLQPLASAGEPRSLRLKRRAWACATHLCARAHACATQSWQLWHPQ